MMHLIEPWTTSAENTADKIIIKVVEGRDEAVLDYENKFSRHTRPVKRLRVTRAEIRHAYKQVSEKEIAAIKLAKKRLEQTEKKTFSLMRRTIKTGPVLRSIEPISSVGCYVPGGHGRYPSTAIMTIVPAKIAGVPYIAVACPPGRDGSIDPMTLVAADMCGADEIYCMGGAQAVAALAFGTESVKRVVKIVGPGGPHVTAAKWLVSADVAIDMIAGPTELCILADSSADAKLVAADLIAQAEHSVHSFCYMLTDSEDLAKRVCKDLDVMVKRGSAAFASLKKHGFAAVCKSQKDAVLIANLLAPEHLQVMTRGPKKVARQIRTAGLVLVGPQTPSAASDYLLGSNHVLPTAGMGKVRGSLSVLDFLRLSTMVESSKRDLGRIAPHMKALTDAEGFPAHYESVRRRVQ